MTRCLGLALVFKLGVLRKTIHRFAAKNASKQLCTKSAISNPLATALGRSVVKIAPL